MLIENKDKISKQSLSEPEIEVNSNFGSVDCEDSQKEIERFQSLRKNKSQFMETLEVSEVKPKKEKKKVEDDLDVRMKDLIKKAEQLANFLITRHKVRKEGDGAYDFSDLKANLKTKRGKKSKGKDIITQLDDDCEDFENEGEQFERLTVQPALLKGGDLKGYQLTGLNWLISLFDIGINGKLFY